MMNTMENIQIIYSGDYKNTNKKQLIKNFYTAFTSQNVEYILDHLENDVHWQIVDKALIIGKETFAKRLKQMKTLRIKTLHIKNIIINGRTGAVNGVVHSADNINYTFCDIFHFSNAGEKSKIQRISTYTNSLSTEITNFLYN